jgi:mRNA-degrading endonuclease RelE of RelBE toxin-antitoxin system
MKWRVRYSHKAAKQAHKLPQAVLRALDFLIADIELGGPARGDWPNYGKLADKLHHCHLKKGHPTYVAAWSEEDEDVRLVEVRYVGTHEKAPY